MSVELLLADLRRKSAERVAAIRRQAENDTAVLRTKLESDLAAARELLAQQRAEAERAVAEPVIRAAEIEALRIEDHALRELAGRLLLLAREQLGQVRGQGYAEIFAGLVAELPEDCWAEVRVHSGDLDLANRHFPEAEIKGDPAISGGFVAKSKDGGLRVISTLERRLEMAWPFALPFLLRKIEEEVHAAPAD